MKKINIKRLLVFFVFGLFVLNCKTQTIVDINNKQQVKKWYKTGEWLNGLEIKPHKTIDQMAFAKEYFSNKELWDKTFKWLKSTDFDNIAPGRYVIEERNAIVTVSEAPAPNPDDVRWEYHEKVNDVQLIIGGKAQMGVSTISKTTVTEPYDERRDIGYFNAPKGKLYLAEPGMLFIFTPVDVHKAGLKLTGYDTIKRLYVKVKAAD